MKVFLTTIANPNAADNNWALGAYKAIQKSAALDTSKKHLLIDDPKLADIILFAELGTQNGPFDEFIRYHPLFKQYASKCYVFMNNDSPIHLIPGIYTSLEKFFYFSSFVHAGFYLSPDENKNLNALDWNPSASYLYSFVGAFKNHKVRQALKSIQDPRFFYKDTDSEYIQATTQGNTTQLKLLHGQFINSLKNSYFILCPRGVGSSSMRLFESMQAARVPVIISDQWVAPVGPKWETFSIKIAEKDVLNIPNILRKHEEKAPHMAQLARQEWEKYFSPPNVFNTIVDWCIDIHSKKVLPFKLMHALSFLQLLRPTYTKRYIKTRYILWREHKKIYL